MKLTHVDESGKACMVDISPKPSLHREAIAVGKIILAPATVGLLRAEPAAEGRRPGRGPRRRHPGRQENG